MSNFDFKTLKVCAEFIRVNYDSLLSDIEIDDSVTEEMKILSDSEYDNLQTLVCVLQEILKFRPLPF